MEKKLVFFDIDGTLLDGEKRLPLSTKQAVKALKESDVEVAIATGRAPFMFKELLEELEIDSFVSFNGQYVVYKGDVIYKNPIDQKIIAELENYTSDKNHPLVFQDHLGMKANYESHPHIDTSINSLKIGHYPTYDAAYYKNREIYQILLFCEEHDEKQYSDRFSELSFIRWHHYSADVLPLGGSKAVGIQRMLERIDVKKENVYAFGDGLNDIEMLQFVGQGIAMGNAAKVVQEAADLVTKDVKEEGIPYGLKLAGLLS
ncbi:Cof-type HAD-IIB family hydrolase [Bacillus taeanensis]|uniref:Cof-type HAD-IIB family hydrolase n=1 Tax=Bacillus taeanensis TaxID=273032 RepID=A0A366XUC1_9BACI|nr:Cof-type HAD-IIB family hydrolase [Bacillus taeanensis]RBW69256.1 Cof-type HAD-IIB family hydrolase [Bacillus taeanensis]